MRTRRARLVSLRASSRRPLHPPLHPPPPRGAFVPSRFLPSSSARARVYIPRASTRGRRPMTSSRPIARPASRARARSLASRADERTKFHAFESPPIASSSVARRRAHIRAHIHIRIRIRDASRPSSRRTSERSPPPLEGAFPPAGRLRRCGGTYPDVFAGAGAFVVVARVAPPVALALAPPVALALAPAPALAPPPLGGGGRSALSGGRSVESAQSLIDSFARGFVRPFVDRSVVVVCRPSRPVPSRRHRHARDLARVSALDDAPRAFVRSVRVDSRGGRYTLKPPRDR